MSDQEITKKAQDGSSGAESGDKPTLSEELDNMSREDRLSAARGMDSAEQKGNLPLPDFRLDKKGELPQDISSYTKTWYNPMRWLSNEDNADGADLYETPQSLLSDGMLKQAAHGILSRNRQLSERLGDDA